MPYSNMVATLAGELPGLSPLLAEQHLTKAWRDVCNARLWSFLLLEGGIPLPAQIVAGSVTYVQYALTVTLNAAASAAVIPYLPGGTPLLTQMQIRFNGGSLYNITGVNSAVPGARVLTLDRAIVEPGGAGIGYQVYRCYIQAPGTDFLRWESLNDFQNGYAILRERLTSSRSEFDQRDPQRQSQGQAFYLGENRGQIAGTPFWELWPHPTSGQIFIATYRSSGKDPDYTSATDAPPPIIPESLIETRARGWYTYPWASLNKANHPAFAKTDFPSLIRDTVGQYNRQLLDVKRVDDEQGLQTVYNRGRGRAGRPVRGPVDAKYWQSHPITW